MPTTLLDIGNEPNGESSIPDRFAYLLSQCIVKTPSQLVNLIAHITMVECGFMQGAKTSNAPAEGENFDQDIPPAGWDSMVSNLTYANTSYDDFTCSLVLVSMGEMKQILVSFPKQDVEISTKVCVNDYVVSGFPPDGKIIQIEDLTNISKLAQKLRNDLLVPLQLASHRILGLPSPFHLAGLPFELLLKTLKFLNVRQVLYVSKTCRRLHTACMDDALWQYMYSRDMGIPPASKKAVEPTIPYICIYILWSFCLVECYSLIKLFYPYLAYINLLTFINFSLFTLTDMQTYS